MSRMQVTERELFQFGELDERAQDKAIENLWDSNIDDDWWNGVYDDAKRAGLNITEFDLGRSRRIKGKLCMSLRDSIQAILSDHGDSCNTHKMARAYKERLDVMDCASRLNPETEEGFEQEVEDMAEEYLRELCEEYLSVLQKEYDYLTSWEAIVESILANEYEFDSEGRLA